MDNEYRNSKIGKAASILYHKLEEGERAINSIISEKFSKKESMNTKDMNVNYPSLPDGEEGAS